MCWILLVGILVTSGLGNSNKASLNLDSTPIAPVSYLKLLNCEPSMKSVNFCILLAPGAYPVVEKNTSSKSGLVKSMMTTKGMFFFKFNSKNGMNVMIENGSWLIRSVSLILKKWTSGVNIIKEDVCNISIWVKFHGTHITAFTEVGLSAIATKLDTPLMLDSYTSTMCTESWGRSSYARAIVELRANTELKDTLMVVVPNSSGEHLGTSRNDEIEELDDDTARYMSFMKRAGGGANDACLLKDENFDCYERYEDRFIIYLSIDMEKGFFSPKGRWRGNRVKEKQSLLGDNSTERTHNQNNKLIQMRWILLVGILVTSRLGNSNKASLNSDSTPIAPVSYAKLLNCEPSMKSVNFRILLAPAGIGRI
ncbi:zinc knuckle CX2CX4HX4C containing protein [Tanacetum coccineum]|uniref:Zinc knuckle CX2CX4HX4C containing protein n=1 Tax=Tanacetum coccineum TaxID=301880 RepID=A0ABQ5A8J6_9ASTR